MRLPWNFRRQPAAGSARRKRPAPLRVRRLERRRVLDAAVADLMFAPADVIPVTSVHDSNEGTQVTVSAAASGTGALSYEWTLTQGATTVAQGHNATFQFTPLDDGNYQVALQVTDSTGSVATRTEALAVHNVRPVLVVATDKAVGEGQSLNLSALGASPLALFVDKGLLDTHTATVNWGDGSPTEAPTIITAPGSGTLGGAHTYNKAGQYTVTVSVLDDDGGAATQSFLVTVNNVAPTATFGNSGPVDEGSSATVSFSNQFEPNPDQAAGGFRYAYDLDNDGTFDVGDGSFGGSVASASQLVSAALLADGPATRTVRGRILTSDGDYTDYTTDIAVHNVAPKLLQVALAAATIDEGKTAKITMTIDDPGGLDVFAVDVDWNDGAPLDTISGLGGTNASGTVGGTTYSWNAQSRELTVSHKYLDDNPTGTTSDVYQISLQVRDNDLTASAIVLANLTIRNVRPVLVVAANQTVNEGAVLDLSQVGAPPLALLIDDGLLDTHTATVNWGDGSAVETPTIIASPGVAALGATHIYKDDGVYTVTVTVSDDDGGTDTKQFQVTVNNVRPVLVVAPDQNANEGALVDLSGIGAPPLGLFIDKGVNDTHTATVNWGDGSAVTTPTIFFANGSGTLGASHTYADDGVYTVTVTVTDDDGGTDTKQFQVTVANVAPTATLGNSGPVAEGSSATVLFTNPTDPSSSDTAAGFRYAYDLNNDGTFDVGDGSYAGSVTATSQLVSSALLAEGPGSHTVRARILDKNGGYTDYTTTIVINNVAPQLINVAVDDATINEGQTATIRMTIADPGALDSFAVTVDWKDGPADMINGLGNTNASGTAGGTSYTWDAQSRQLAVTHRFVDDNPTGTASDLYLPTLVVADDDGGSSGPYQVQITVSNVRPVIVGATDQTVDEGALLNLSAIGAPPLALFIDDGKADTHTVTVNWGDGSGNQAANLIGASGSFAIGATHTYLDNGIYTVTITVVDDDGGSDTATFAVTVNNVVPTLTDITVVSAAINEGQSAEIQATLHDPSPLDVFSIDVDWRDGGPVDTITGLGNTNANGAVGSTSYSWDAATRVLTVSHLYVDDNPTATASDPYLVSLAVRDDDGGQSGPYDATITVNNVAPQLVNVAAVDTSINEGQTAVIRATIQDPGAPDIFSVDVDWRDGSPLDTITGLGNTNASGSVGGTTYEWDAATRLLTVRHLYADDNPTATGSDPYTVSLTVRDDDLGQSATSDVQLTVANVRPVLVVADNQTINEGSLLNLSAVGASPLAQFVDDGKLDTHVVSVNWGDGSAAEAGTLIGANGTFTVGGSHTYADNGTYTVTVTVTDDDGGVDQHTFTVTVQNVDPTLSGAANHSLSEGTIFTLSSLGIQITDPGFDNPNNPLQQPGGSSETFQVASIDWGDGNSTTAATVENRVSGAVGVATTADIIHPAHAYADDGQYTVTVTLKDDDGGLVARTFQILVTNVVPTLTLEATGNYVVNESETITLPLLASFTDPGYDNPNNPAGVSQESFRYYVDWGDGRDQISGAPVADTNGAQGIASTGSFGGAHNYADNGVYTVTIRVADDDMSGNFTAGAAGVDFAEVTFTITVNNVGPTVVPQPNGAPLQGDDINTDGITTIRIAYRDPGYDNLLNTNSANGGERVETFDHIVQWGDGTVDAIHQYTSGGSYTVTVTMTPIGGVAQQFTFNNFNSSNPVLTLVSSQSINDPGVVPQIVAYVVDWGDGNTQTYQLSLLAPGVPVASNGLTTLVASSRIAGNADVETTGSAAIQHRYTGPPNPLNPTADITIVDTLYDDDGAGVANSVTVSNPGIQTINIAIDTTPDVPRLDLTIRPATDAYIADQGGLTQLLQVSDVRGGGGEIAANTERYLELRVVYPDGNESQGYRIPDEALADLRAFFARFPDGRYAIYLVRTENHSERLVIEVDVRHGRIIDQSDDSEGTRDRPPTGEEDSSAAQPPQAPQTATPPAGEAAAEATADNATPAEPAPQSASLAGPLAVSLAASSWSSRVDEALAAADDSAWRRLRRAARCRVSLANSRQARLPVPTPNYNT